MSTRMTSRGTAQSPRHSPALLRFPQQSGSRLTRSTDPIPPHSTQGGRSATLCLLSCWLVRPTAANPRLDSNVPSATAGDNLSGRAQRPHRLLDDGQGQPLPVGNNPVLGAHLRGAHATAACERPWNIRSSPPAPARIPDARSVWWRGLPGSQRPANWAKISGEVWASTFMRLLSPTVNCVVRWLERARESSDRGPNIDRSR